MRLPDFLIIGAMKAGTTTLYRDLLTHPRVYFPADKEPENLVSDAVLTDEGRAAYAAMFQGARPDQLCGEASTAYTKRPTHEGVASRAKRLLGDDLRVIYLMREPVSRVVSQHRHELGEGEIGESDLGEALVSHPRLIEYSRYAMQLEPWIDALGHGRVLALEMERYTKDRRGTVARVQQFLGLDPMPELVDAEKVYNKGEGKPMLRGGWRTIQQTGLYLRLIRPLLSVELREKLRHRLLPKAEAEAAQADEAALASIRAALRGDKEQLADLLGDDAPSWCRTADEPARAGPNLRQT